MSEVTITMSGDALRELREHMPAGLNAGQVNALLRAAQAVYEQGQKEGAIQSQAIRDVLSESNKQPGDEEYRETAMFTDTQLAHTPYSEDRPTISLRKQEKP